MCYVPAVLHLTVLGWNVASAEPASDPTLLLVERLVREQGVPVFRGAPDRSPLAQAWQLKDADIDPLLASLLAGELAAVAGEGDIRQPMLRPGGVLSLGTQIPEYRSGDTEPGLLAGRVWADIRAYPGPLEITVRPEVLGDGDGLSVTARELWVGARGAHVFGGLGLRERFVGPGRHSGLMLTDNGQPAPMVSFGGQGGPWGWFGSLRGEVGVGWLNAPREDVNHPGWLMMDFRWLPLPILEFGVSRFGIFGGEGRPAPSIGQLILPTDPHIYDDPNQLLPDQDEMAAIDVRLTLPLSVLAPGVYAEGWWQYGGEDVIARKSLGIPYPALAGVANLYGGEVGVGPWAVTVEATRALDDYFRWYTGHRVYHDGFTQNGQSMGYAPGGDAMGLWGALTWLPGEHGGQLSAESLTRVGIVGALEDNLFALSQEEVHTRLSASGWLRQSDGTWLRLELSVDRVTGVNFVPDTAEVRYRLALSRG
ncbi:MAG: hypothetical protein ACI8RZ_004413 [Myxococcota bacterium]|jgi:hypothetical protein